MNKIPGLTLRASEEAEIEGIDEAEIGEIAYEFVERRRDYIAPPKGIKERIVSSSSSLLGTVSENVSDTVEIESVETIAAEEEISKGKR
jgi:hypothetical protein